MTDYESVVEVFESEIREKYELPPDLIQRWFYSAVAEFELDIGQLYFDKDTDMFNNAPPYVIRTLGLLIAKSYLKREMSRINKLQNIIGKDIQLNSTSQAKAETRQEYEGLLLDINEKLHKIKRHAYN